LGPMPALASVDALIQSQQIIHRVAKKHGFAACFLPYPAPAKSSPSGLHAHVSFEHIQQATGNNQRQEQESHDAVGDHFLAGVLNRIPALCAFGMPSIESYQRVKPGVTGEWCSWGTGNRDTPVRRIGPQHFEFRTIDGASNMYLALAAHIGAGVLGIAHCEPLSWKDCGAFVFKLGEDELKKYGITTRMPKSLSSALESMNRDAAGLERVVGERMWDFYRVVKGLESKHLFRKRGHGLGDFFTSSWRKVSLLLFLLLVATFCSHFPSHSPLNV
jgi:glutamine synthetase